MGEPAPIIVTTYTELIVLIWTNRRVSTIQITPSIARCAAVGGHFLRRTSALGLAVAGHAEASFAARR